LALEGQKQTFLEFFNRNGRNENVIDECIALVEMASKQCPMVRVIFWKILGLSNGVRGRGCSVVQGEKCDFAVGSTKNSVDKGFVYFAEIGFGIWNFESKC
jgi:hypothetical protein